MPRRLQIRRREGDVGLFTPIIDVPHRAYCGPTAIAALTGVPVSRIEKMIRRGRRNGYRDSRGRKLRIKGTYTWEVVRTLRRLGCKVAELNDPESTFASFVQDTIYVDEAFLVEVTGHFMATFRGECSDPIGGYRGKRRVVKAWRVKAPIVPRYTVADAINPPTRPAKQRPSLQAVRALRAAEALRVWEAKLRRAVKAVRKARARVRRYEKIGVPHLNPALSPEPISNEPGPFRGTKPRNIPIPSDSTALTW